MSVIRAFTLDQAATIANVSKRRAAYWARHGIVVPSLAYDADRLPHRYLYDFVDLVGLRTLGMLRDRYNLSLQQLRTAHRFLREHAGRPWSELRFWVRGKELLFTDPATGDIVSSDRPGQTAIAIELEPVVQSVEQAARALAQRRPAGIGETERHRNIQGNRLVVKGTRVPVESILNLAVHGYASDRIVRSYP
jgi:uncharacterized protein (DUF433 family)